MTRARSVSKLINSNILTIDEDNTNNVGIGSTTPTEKLDVVGVISATTFIGERVGIGTTANEYELNIVGGANVSGIVTAQSFSGDGSLLTDLNLTAGGWTNDGLTPILYNTSLAEVGIGTSSATGSKLTVDAVGSSGTSLFVNGEARFAGIITGTDATFTNVVKVGSAITADATSGIITATGVNATGVVTATTFVGNVTGNVTGDLTGSVTGNVTGNATGLSGSPSITVTNITAADITATGTLTYEDVTNIDSIGIVTAQSGIEFGASGVGGTITADGHVEFSGIVTASSYRGDGSNLSGIALDITSSLFT